MRAAGRTRGHCTVLWQYRHVPPQGTIEEGMLSLLAFKKSLFEGVLDAAAEVSLKGTRLARFMESVEGRGAEAAAQPGAEAPVAIPAGPTAAAEQPRDPWRGLVDAGVE